MFRRAPQPRKANERPVTRPSFNRLSHRESDDRKCEGPVLRRNSRFRADDEVDDSGRVYLTARYSTRFE